jgi:hypothetical protein
MESENTPFELHDPELEALALALHEDRPTPHVDFTSKLDDAVADHFPPEWSDGVTNENRAGFFARLGSRFGRPRQALLLVTAGFAGLLLVVVTVGVGLDGSESTDTTSPDAPIASTESAPSAGGASSAGGTTQSSTADSVTAPVPNSPEAVTQKQFRDSPGAYAAGTKDRKVATEADITLGTDPENVQDVSNEIVDVVDDHNGIVLDSSVRDGPAGQAGASFSLMIPSEQVESAIGDLSGIADLRARTQETEDITAPTLTVEDSLRDSRARVDSLVKELSESTTDEDRTRIEAELASERRQAARLNTRLNKLERRANLTPVGVTVETGGDTGSDEGDSSWGIGDAFDDAGKLLGVSAGVALIALAIAVPIGLMVLISLALNRAWVRHSRRRALEEN